jgi:hypothetical protein
MDIFLFLWIYFGVSTFISLIIFILYLSLLRYGDLIRRSSKAKAIVAAILLASSLTFLWYSISTTLTIFNKWFMTRWQGGFKFPLLSTSVHMVSNKQFLTLTLTLTLRNKYFHHSIIHIPFFSLSLFLSTLPSPPFKLPLSYFSIVVMIAI